MKPKALGIIKVVFSVVGLGMLALAFYLTTSTMSFTADALEANGVVVDLVSSRSSDSTTYRPVVEFTTQTGQQIEFVSSTGSNPPSYSRGEEVVVLYNPGTPENARIDGFFSLWGAPLIVGVMGFIFAAVGLSMIWFPYRRKQDIELLKTSGSPVLAEFTGVERNTSLSVNGRNPWQVHAKWHNPTTNEIHLFASDNIWFDPSDYMTEKHLTVFVDDADADRYYIDLSFLPKVAD